MDSDKKYIIDGYRFKDSSSYEMAKRELEEISRLKKEYDLLDEKQLREVYDKSIQDKRFKTPIGIGFLREAQKKLVKSEEQRRTMKAIPIHDKIIKEDESSLLRDRIKKLSIVICFLVFLVIVPFSVVIYDKIRKSTKEEEMINSYATWKEELTNKERELREKEEIIADLIGSNVNK